jgi:hypothetical protein
MSSSSFRSLIDCLNKMSDINTIQLNESEIVNDESASMEDLKEVDSETNSDFLNIDDDTIKDEEDMSDFIEPAAAIEDGIKDNEMDVLDDVVDDIEKSEKSISDNILDNPIIQQLMSGGAVALNLAQRKKALDLLKDYLINNGEIKKTPSIGESEEKETVEESSRMDNKRYTGMKKQIINAIGSLPNMNVGVAKVIVDEIEKGKIPFLKIAFY